MDEHLTRTEDHTTSESAARKTRAKLNAKQTIVLRALKANPEGLTDEELAAAIVRMGHPAGAESTYRKRRTELYQKGLAEDTGRRRANARGMSVIVWALKPQNEGEA